MYDYINGKFSYKNSSAKGNFATVETGGGVGYLFEIMARDYANLPEVGENLKMFSVLIHREDKMSLCGFLKEKTEIFLIFLLLFPELDQKWL